MKNVTPFEANLLRILRCFLGQVPLEQALPIIVRKFPEPKCLSREAVELIQDSLAKGCTQFLALRGWPKESFLRNFAGKTGRLWERTAPEELAFSFSGNTMRTLIWLTADPVAEKKTRPKIDRETLTIGDWFFFYLMYEELKETGIAEIIRSTPPIQKAPLFGLFFPDACQVHNNISKNSFTPWVTGQGACILETLQDRLVERWVEMERKKRLLTNPDELREIGNTQFQVLSAFVEAIEQQERLDLARFLMRAIAQTVTLRQPGEHWFPNINLTGYRMADRSEVYRTGLALLHQSAKLEQWQQRAYSTGFYDDNYESSQLWKEDWERLRGEQIVVAAREIIDSLELMPV